MSTGDILLSDLELARRLERADVVAGAECLSIHAKHHSPESTESMEVAGGLAMFAGVDSHLTHTVGVGMAGPVGDDDIERMEAFYRDRGSRVEMEVCPLADESLHRVLAERGYRFDQFTNTLYQELGPDDSTRPMDDRVTIEVVESSGYQHWAEIVSQGFFGTQQVTADVVDVVKTACEMETGATHLARCDGVPAGGGSAAIFDGLVALFGQSTLNEYRNRGIQNAIIAAGLNYGRQKACKLAMICTLPGSTSQRNAERNGFRVAYTRCKMVRDL
jgi:hypothetical protein